MIDAQSLFFVTQRTKEDARLNACEVFSLQQNKPHKRVAVMCATYLTEAVV